MFKADGTAPVDVLFNGSVDVKYGFIYFQPQWLDVDILRARGGQSNGLCGAAYPGTLVTATGLHSGTVPLRIELHPRPPLVDDGWQDVVEVSLTTPGSAYLLMAFDWSAKVSMPPPGTYRARWSATGMDEAADCDDSSMQERGGGDRYLLQLWPAVAAPDAIVRQGSHQAAAWHALAARTPPPPACAALESLAIDEERRRYAPWAAVRAEQDARAARTSR